MTISDTEFDALVSGFYQAATGTVSWEAALQGVHGLLGTRTTALHSADLVSGRIVHIAHAGSPMPEAWLEFVRRWHVIDPRRNHLLTHSQELMGQWWHCHEHFDEAFVAQDRFYQQFLVGTDVRYESTAVFSPSPGIGTGLSLQLSAQRGPLSTDERHLAQRLGKHLGDALRLYERLRCVMAEALAGHALLDAMAHPMWLLDAGRFICHANPAALRWAAGSGQVATRGNRLSWASGKVDRALGEVLCGLGGGMRHGDRRIFDARASREDAPVWLHVHVVEPVHVLGGMLGQQPMALVTLFDPSMMGPLDPFALSEMFGMTPAESRVAALLAEGLSAEAISTRLGCKEGTVRTHIRKVLHKLGARSSADAVRLLRQGEALWAQPRTDGMDHSTSP